MRTAEIAGRLRIHLERCEVTQKLSYKPDTDRIGLLDKAGAAVVGRCVAVTYVRGHGQVTLSKADAEAYLQWIESSGRVRLYCHMPREPRHENRQFAENRRAGSDWSDVYFDRRAKTREQHKKALELLDWFDAAIAEKDAAGHRASALVMKKAVEALRGMLMLPAEDEARDKAESLSRYDRELREDARRGGWAGLADFDRA